VSEVLASLRGNAGRRCEHARHRGKRIRSCDQTNRLPQASVGAATGRTGGPTAVKKEEKTAAEKSDGTIENSLGKMCRYGLAGGSIASVIWILVAYFSGDAWGFLACLVGVFTGVGVETGMDTSEDSRAGETGAIITILLNIGCRCIVALLLAGEISQAAIFDSTSRYDILWFVLSAVISYVIGAGILFD
jgi:hypothetical protein